MLHRRVTVDLVLIIFHPLYRLHGVHCNENCQHRWALWNTCLHGKSVQHIAFDYPLQGFLGDRGLHQLYMFSISNNSSFRQNHPGVPDGCDCSDGTSYPLAENYTLPVAQATRRIAYVLLYLVVTFTHHQMDTCVTLFAGAAVMLKPFTQRLAMLNHSY